MASSSDIISGTNVVDLLPEVYRSEVNKTLLEASFNKFLSKDDTQHRAGYVGQGTVTALQDRQLKEPSPHRQAFQLAPVVYSTVGTDEYVLTFKGFQQQLDLMGVDTSRLDTWASTTRFNWIPPVNLDMLINYSDYFWKPAKSQAPSQYFTIENRCNKVTSKLNAYKSIIARRGETMDIVQIDFAKNGFVVNDKHDDLFVNGFIFSTRGTPNINLQDRVWIASSSTYDSETDLTTIVVTPELCISTVVTDPTDPISFPTASYNGQWWYRYRVGTDGILTINQLYTWTGAIWALTSQSFPAIISLTEQAAIYQDEVNCACKSNKIGWDEGQWDDNQETVALWSDDYVADISALTEAQWIADHGTPITGSQWYDTTDNQLKQYSIASSQWIIVHENFSDVIANTTGIYRWDATVGCEVQVLNQWSEQNEWVHKAELTSFEGVYRAQVPILEYSSETELNEWTEVNYKWKYRSESTGTFESTTSAPSRLELEPIKSFVVTDILGVWHIYLTSVKNSANRDIDYTSIFTPGYKFRIVDRLGLIETFTVSQSVYREIASTDPADLPIGYFTTVVQIDEVDFNVPLVAGAYYEPTPTEPTPPYTRIEPITTSAGDGWRGYHVHWVLDVESTSYKPAAPQMVNLYSKANKEGPATIISTGGPLDDHWSQYITDTYMECTLSGAGAIDNEKTIYLDNRFIFNNMVPGYYAIPGDNNIRVYVNGVRQQGSYTELTVDKNGAPIICKPDFTIVNGLNLNSQIADQTSFLCVTGIEFANNLKAGDVVRIEPAPASFVDMGSYGLPVRTVESDVDFSLGVDGGTQPAYRSLALYQKTEQAKTKINQYPIFNMYDVVTSEIAGTSHIFGFAESAEYSVNPSTQRRIVTTADGKEYQFEQYLVSEHNGVMYAYRTVTGNESTYWYSPLLQTLTKWDGNTWADKIVSYIDSGMIVHTPVVSAIEPIHLRDQHTSIWVNSSTAIAYQRDTISGVWSPLQDVMVSDVDPTLTTIWKTSTTKPTYTPSYVDKDRVVVDKTSQSGDWEVVSQWKNNPEHENHKQIWYSQLITHLASVVAEQNPSPGLINRGIFALTQADYDYGLGGTIKEHNDAFDTLISAVNVSEMTPISIIEFAQDQYLANATLMRDLFGTTIVDMLIAFSGSSMSDVETKIVDSCITSFENNDFLSAVYGDTTAYNRTTSVGMPNWIATLPIIGHVNKVKPFLVYENGTGIITHHDGHRSFVSLTVAEQDRYSRILIQTLNESGTVLGVISPTPPSGSILPIYWYCTAANNRALYKLKTTLVGNTPVYLWEIVDFTKLVCAVLLDIEHRLYDITPVYPIPVFDFDTLTANTALTDVYNELMLNRFMQYVVKKNINTPLVNVSYNITDPFTYNYASCLITTPPKTLSTSRKSCWQALYQYWYGTPYPHLEPWALQGYASKPTWWDTEYADSTGIRRWRYNHATKTGMWENIRTGVVPAGYAYPGSDVISTGNPSADVPTMPNGWAMPTYTYFSVNISDDVITGGYTPDAMLPPYYDITNIAPIHPTVRSLFTVFSAEILAPSADYIYGEQGPSEWEWTVSSEYLYDRSIVAFQMEPVKFLHQTFGTKYVQVRGLHIDATFKKVYDHQDTLFHGDLHDTNVTYVANGLNQWYVNFNRFNGFDTNVGFRTTWTQWEPRQSYQTAGIVDTNTLQIFNKNFDVTDRDYKMVLANSGVISEVWSDAFNISILNIPSAIIQYNNQSRWKFSVDTLAPVARDVQYYGTQVWPVKVDTATNEFTAFQFDIVDVTASARTVEVSGNQAPFLVPGVGITITGSSTNDGSYNVVRATYDAVLDTTRILVDQPLPTSIIDGLIDIPTYAHNWVTGDMVAVTSAAPLPYPITESTAYYIISTGPRTFKIAATSYESSVLVDLDITSKPAGLLTVGKVKSTFFALGGGNTSAIWIHYELNTADIRTIRPPVVMTGMQSIINLVDGYEALQFDRGVIYNRSSDFTEYDSDTGRPITWQVETERFIDWAYGLVQARLQISDRFEFTVYNATDNTLRFTSSVPAWTSGSAVALTTTGSLPSPLFGNTQYYFIPTEDPQVFKLSVSPRGTDTSYIIDITSGGSGIMSIALFRRSQAYPSFELNPSRNNIWADTPLGMLSNVLTGPYADIRVSQALYDQYGRFITADKITVYRADKSARISMQTEVFNDVELNPYGFVDPYNYLHIGGGHFFIEGYEHIIMFNNYTVGDDLVYDPFLGLASRRFDLDYYEKADYTLRPTIGGYYLTGNDFKRNFEGSIEDIRNYYDAYTLTEGTPEAVCARETVGYSPNDGNMSFLDLLNVNTKSQFLFYRGMIQSKGSISSIKAYINSKKFVDAKVDEFWMYKISDFGDSREKKYPHIKLFAKDGVKTDVRLKFAIIGEDDPTLVEDVSNGFDIVSFRNTERWVDYPQQRSDLASPLFLNANFDSVTRLYATTSLTNGRDIDPIAGQNTVDYWIHNQIGGPLYVRQWNGTDDWTDISSTGLFKKQGHEIFVKLGNISDAARVLHHTIAKQGDLTTGVSRVFGEAPDASGFTRTNSEIIKFNETQYAFEYKGTVEGSMFAGLTISGDMTGVFFKGDKFIIGTTVYTVSAVSPYDITNDYTIIASTNPPHPNTAGTLTHIGFTDLFTIFTINPSTDKITPARLLDVESHTKVKDIPLWHPALGIHSPIAAHNVDLISGIDPARYSVTKIDTDRSALPWVSPEAGTMWLDASALGYMPYYDDIIYPDINDRLYRWGQQQAWSTTRVYQWVETLIHPDEWLTIADRQSGNISIPPAQRVTGTPRTTVYRRERPMDIVSIASATTGEIAFVSPLNTITENTVILFSPVGDATLPKGVEAGVSYIVESYNTTTGHALIVDEDGTPVDFTGSLQLNVVCQFTENWIKKPIITERLYAALLPTTSTILLSDPDWKDGDVADVYVNGIMLTQGISVASNTVNLSGLNYVMDVKDVIDVIRQKHTLTPGEAAFNPDVSDDGVTLVDWDEIIEHASTTRTYDGVQYTYYYYWVENITVRRNTNNTTSVSAKEVADQLTKIPTPFLTVQYPRDTSTHTYYDADQQFMPTVFYRKAILSSIAPYITDDDRYVIEFTQDLTLRDNLEADRHSMNLKNKHEKWFMFRRDQIGAVPVELWRKMTEALMGCTYNDLTIRLPSFDREYYDETNGTETKYGLGEGQIFVNPLFARKTIVHYLQDPSHDFKPISIDQFFETYPAATDEFWADPVQVKAMCDYMYNTFDTIHSNGIWFEVLSDALVTKAKYSGLMKTSWLALHGIRILDVNGAFDD